MNSNYKFSRNQMLALCSSTFLSPALRLFPASAADIAGRASWLAAPAALPLLLGYVYLLCKLMEGTRENEGLAELCLRSFGNRSGKIILALFSAWFLLYAGFVLRTGADRLITTIYPHTSPKFFVISMGLLCLFAALCPVRSIARTAKLVMPVLFGMLLLMLFFSFFSIEKANLLPITLHDTLPIMKAGISALNVLVGVLYSACFLGGIVKREDGRFSAYAVWVSLSVFLLGLINLCITGCFGSELTSQLTRPFFSLVRSLVFFSSIERLEALLVTLWIIPDFLLVAFVLCCAQHCLRLVVGIQFSSSPPKILDFRDGRWLIWLCSSAVIVLGLFIAPDTASLELWSKQIIPYMNLAVAFLLIPFIYIFSKIKKKL